jgi:hypothetical protein
MEGIWTKNRQGRRLNVFLFTDLLLLCEPARSKPGMFKPHIDVSSQTTYSFSLKLIIIVSFT